MNNPRQYAWRERRKAGERFAAMNAPCGICGGARGGIHYDEPRNHHFPLSLVIDEIHPVARWEEFGYASARACACDPLNWQPAHYICNLEASDKRKRRKRRIGTNDATSGTF